MIHIWEMKLTEYFLKDCESWLRIVKKNLKLTALKIQVPVYLATSGTAWNMKINFPYKIFVKRFYFLDHSFKLIF